MKIIKDVPIPSGSSAPEKQNPPRGPMKKISQPALEIGEADLLAAIIDEMPGMDHDQRTMRLLHERQAKHLQLLDKEAKDYTAKVRQKDAKVAQVRERQRKCFYINFSGFFY